MIRVDKKADVPTLTGRLLRELFERKEDETIIAMGLKNVVNAVNVVTFAAYLVRDKFSIYTGKIDLNANGKGVRMIIPCSYSQKEGYRVVRDVNKHPWNAFRVSRRRRNDLKPLVYSRIPVKQKVSFSAMGSLIPYIISQTLRWKREYPELVAEVELGYGIRKGKVYSAMMITLY